MGLPCVFYVYLFVLHTSERMRMEELPVPIQGKYRKIMMGDTKIFIHLGKPLRLKFSVVYLKFNICCRNKKQQNILKKTL